MTQLKKKPKRKSSPAKITNAAVAKTFDGYPKEMRQPLLSLRQLILETAAETPGVGALEETLKWGEPAYVTTESKSGSTVRINAKPGSDSRYAMYFNCKTSLVDTFRTLFPETFAFEGNRGIVFDVGERLPKKELQTCISMALTYHRSKK